MHPGQNFVGAFRLTDHVAEQVNPCFLGKIVYRPVAELDCRMCLARHIDQSFSWFQSADVVSQAGEVTGPTTSDIQDRTGHCLRPWFNDRAVGDHRVKSPGQGGLLRPWTLNHTLLKSPPPWCRRSEEHTS